jgi:chromosome segregation ATPase
LYSSEILSSPLCLSRLVQDASLSSGAHGQALDTLKAQLSQALGQLDREREDHQAEKLRFMEKESVLESEQTRLLENSAVLQKQVAAEQSRAVDLQGSLQSAQREAQALRKEHEDYKQRASGILQV